MSGGKDTTQCIVNGIFLCAMSVAADTAILEAAVSVATVYKNNLMYPNIIVGYTLNNGTVGY